MAGYTGKTGDPVYDMLEPFDLAGPTNANVASSQGFKDLRASIVSTLPQKVMNKLNQEERLREAQITSFNRPAPTGPSKGSIGTEQLTPRRKAEDNYSWWEREQMDRQKAERDNAQGLKFTMDKRNQDMSFLQKLLGLMGSGGMGGGNAGSGGSGGFNRSSNEGYTEQIFNSAGAPQIVRLKNGNQGSNSNQSDILKMLMGMMG